MPDSPGDPLSDLRRRVEEAATSGSGALPDPPRPGSEADSAEQALLARIRALPELVGAERRRGGSRRPDPTSRRLAALAEAVAALLVDAVRLNSADLATRLADLAAGLEDVVQAVAAAELRAAAATSQVEALAERVSALEGAEAGRRFRPFFSAQAFDDAFRGSRGAVLDRYHDIADELAATGGPVIDLGCGRGELLELLAARGVEARGVEVVPELVAACARIGLQADLIDAMGALRQVGDASLGGAALIQVVEHVPAQELTELVVALRDKVRPGGLVVAETVNAVSPYVFTRSFFLDPTHTNPVHPAYLSWLFEQAGFAEVRVGWRSPVPVEEQVPLVGERLAAGAGDGEVAALAGAVDVALRRLNEHLFPAQDYAVLAVR